MLGRAAHNRFDADDAARLIAFVDQLSERLVPPAERAGFLVPFALLSGLALRATGHAALCSDGTPIEFSLSLDARGHHALRYVCDAGLPPPAWSGDEQTYYREIGERVIPQFDGREEALDRLFSAHLANAPSAARFKVWFGGAASRGKGRTGLIYCNTEWLTTAELAAILVSRIGDSRARRCVDLADTLGASYAGVAYDFDAAGHGKTKLYFRLDPARVRDLDTALSHFPDAARDQVAGLFDRAFGAVPIGQRGGTMLALGMGTDATTETSAYFHLPSWGVPDFAALSPIASRLLAAWDVPADLSFSTGPAGCAPTLLSLGVSGGCERMAIYFRPLLTRSSATSATLDELEPA